MNLFSFSGSVAIAALILFGAGLLVASFVFNLHLAKSVVDDNKHQEKVFEYVRNASSQLGIILIGIGVSLFIFYLQQAFQAQRQKQIDLDHLLANYSVRIARADALARFLGEFDQIVDDGGPYANPEDGGSNRAITASGADLVKQVQAILAVERDVDLDGFAVLHFSQAFELSDIANELDPDLWLVMVQNENDMDYAIAQLGADYRDLNEALKGQTPEAAIADPATAAAVKHEALDVLWDMALLRYSSRVVIGTACWLLSNARAAGEPPSVSFVKARINSHQSWIEQAKIVLSEFKFGGSSCYEILRYTPPKTK